MADYARAWEPVRKVNLTQLRSEVNPQFVSIVPPSDAVWVIEVEMSFEEVSEKMCFCLPYGTLEPVMDRLKARYQSESMGADNTWRGRIEETLSIVPVEITAQLGTAQITGRQVLALRAGDIIQLNERCDEPLDLFIENVLKLRGRAGTSRRQKAVQVTELFKTGLGPH